MYRNFAYIFYLLKYVYINTLKSTVQAKFISTI